MTADRGSLHFTVDEHPAESDARVVEHGLRAFNVAVIGEPNEVPLGVFLRDRDGHAIGGLTGSIKWRWLYVAKFWLPDSVRGQGHGARLLNEAEARARQHKCIGVYLDTFEYQALPFYEKCGYELIGTLEGFPPGYRQFHLQKRLDQAER